MVLQQQQKNYEASQADIILCECMMKHFMCTLHYFLSSFEVFFCVSVKIVQNFDFCLHKHKKSHRKTMCWRERKGKT